MYSIDSADKSRDPERKEVTKFFKDELGFKDNEIEFVDRTNFYFEEETGWLTKFSDEELKRLNESAKRIFGDKKHGLGKQILKIAICEC